MTMRPRFRRIALTAHVIASVGWLGTVGAFLALAIVGVTTEDAQIVRSVYPALALLGALVIVPCSFAALATGVIQSLGTEWGLVRHYWVATKFVLTLGATTLLLVHMSVVRDAAGIAAGTIAAGDFPAMQARLVVDASLAIIVLLANTVLSIYKPWGRVTLGRRAATLALAFAAAILLLAALVHLTGFAGHH